MEDTKRGGLAWIVLGILVGGFAVAFLSTSEHASAYTPRGPITITGNSEFTDENGVTGGTGTMLDPYIIEGWEIEVFMTTGVSITGTDAFFVIRNMHIFNSNFTASVGIGLWDVHNGWIANSSLTGMKSGIEMTVSSQILVIDLADDACDGGARCPDPNEAPRRPVSDAYRVHLPHAIVDDSRMTSGNAQNGRESEGKTDRAGAPY